MAPGPTTTFKFVQSYRQISAFLAGLAPKNQQKKRQDTMQGIFMDDVAKINQSFFAHVADFSTKRKEYFPSAHGLPYGSAVLFQSSSIILVVWGLKSHTKGYTKVQMMFLSE